MSTDHPRNVCRSSHAQGAVPRKATDRTQNEHRSHTELTLRRQEEIDSLRANQKTRNSRILFVLEVLAAFLFAQGVAWATLLLEFVLTVFMVES